MTNEKLVTDIQNGNHDLMDQLWRQCYGFIRQQAIKWARAWESRPDFDADDLTQAGYIALCEAVRVFQKDRGGFLGFLSFYLKTEFSKVAGCHTSKKEPLNNAISLDAPAFNDPDNQETISENIVLDGCGRFTIGKATVEEDPCIEAVRDRVFNGQLAAVLEKAMKELPESQRKVIELYYLRRMTYIQIAEILHCSTSYSGQLAKDGLKGLKNGSYAPALSEMLYGERNYYRNTGFNSWKYSGTSSPERELLRKEYKMRRRNLLYCVEHLGMTMEQAEWLFPG